MLKLTRTETNSASINIIYLLAEGSSLAATGINEAEQQFIDNQISNPKTKKDFYALNRLGSWVFVAFVKDNPVHKQWEQCRRTAVHVLQVLNTHGHETCVIDANSSTVDAALAFAEGMMLGNYQFIKYLRDASEKQNSLHTVYLQHEKLEDKQLSTLIYQAEANLWARDLINEPLNQLNASALAHQIAEKVQSVGVKAEVLNKKKIEALKMGGLLAVNLGSIDPPTFTILEWKPDNASNQQPVVLVGKGVVYDTGGMSLKPSNAMDTMKCDMSGAAAVAAIVYAAAKSKLPLYIIALIPATDNRVNGNAYVPGDIITMFDGTTVEVLNTDAEGRLILADALSYAKKYDPMLVINYATLTGAASRAIGSQGIVAMQVKAEGLYKQLSEAGMQVYERLVEFPMWDEYKEQLRSEIADMKNIGGPEAGMITAGKFLEHFTNYPFIHLDIAGPAFIEKRDSYRGQGGTGTGVRLTFKFLQQL